MLQVSFPYNQNWCHGRAELPIQLWSIYNSAVAGYAKILGQMMNTPTIPSPGMREDCLEINEHKYLVPTETALITSSVQNELDYPIDSQLSRCESTLRAHKPQSYYLIVYWISEGIV